MAIFRQRLQSHPKGWARATVAAYCWQIQKLRHSRVMCPRSQSKAVAGRGTPPKRLLALHSLPAWWPAPMSHVRATGRQHIWVQWNLSLCGGGRPSKGVLQHSQIAVTHQCHEQPLSLLAAKLANEELERNPKRNQHTLVKIGLEKP